MPDRTTTTAMSPIVNRVMVSAFHMMTGPPKGVEISWIDARPPSGIRILRQNLATLKRPPADERQRGRTYDGRVADTESLVRPIETTAAVRGVSRRGRCGRCSPGPPP